MKKAKIVEIEGCDGSGKTTALKYLIDQLRAAGKTVLETREVGNPNIPTCVKLRELVLNPESDLAGESMEFIFAAMRIENQRFYKKVGDQYDFIVSDRGWLSHLAYTDHNVSSQFTEDFYCDVVATMTEVPDVVIYMNVNTEIALKRRVKRGTGMDVIEMKDVEFQEKVRKSFEHYLHVLDNDVEGGVGIFNIDANDSVSGVQGQMDRIIEEIL